MEISTEPTNLKIYYCEECGGIVATTHLSSVTSGLTFECPFCFLDSLVELPKEDYQENFNLDLFPYPQNIIIQKFFETADNTANLLNTFSQVDPMILLKEQFLNINSFIGVHILIDPQINLNLKIEIDDNNAVSIRGNGSNLIDVLSQSS